MDKNLRRSYENALKREQAAQEAAEKVIGLNGRLSIQLDVQTKYAEELNKTVKELKSREPEVVEVPLVIEIVPDKIRKRMSDLSRENRELAERVEQLEMILVDNQLLLPE